MFVCGTGPFLCTELLNARDSERAVEREKIFGQISKRRFLNVLYLNERALNSERFQNLGPVWLCGWKICDEIIIMCLGAHGMGQKRDPQLTASDVSTHITPRPRPTMRAPCASVFMCLVLPNTWESFHKKFSPSNQTGPLHRSIYIKLKTDSWYVLPIYRLELSWIGIYN